jgi:hypothetical protein
MHYDDAAFVLFLLTWGWVGMVILSLGHLILRWLFPGPGAAYRRRCRWRQ